MSAIAIRLLLVLALAMALMAGSYWAGDHNRNNAWLAKQATVERSAHAKYEAEVVRGEKAVGNFITEQQALQSNFQNLTEKFNGLTKRVPLVVAARSHACAADASSVEPVPNKKQLARPETLDDSQRAGDGGPVLTAGAVWMWNSALTGTDQPAGACGLADTSAAACAAATTATLDDALANHRTNAQTCAEDRLAHQRLIDYLNRRNLRLTEGAGP